nr:IS630 family transposase [Ktedonobacter sp. SOSP1-52]
MPKRVQARAAQDKQEERQVRKLARSLHAPADWKFHAHMVVESWASKTPQEIATTLSCHPRTVCIHLNRFNAQGINGLGMREGAGRKPRLTEQERSRILALAKQPPPGKLERYADGTLDARDEEGSAQWSLDAFTDSAHAAGIQVERSQIRRMYLREGKRWRHTHSWGTSDDKDACPKRTAVVTHSTQPPAGSTTICADELGPVTPRTFAPAPGWSPDGHRIKAPLEYSRGDDKVWIYGALRVRDGKELTRCAATRHSKNSIELLKDIEADNPTGEIFIITDNLSSQARCSGNGISDHGLCFVADQGDSFGEQVHIDELELLEMGAFSVVRIVPSVSSA